MKAVTVRVDDIAGVAGFILPGDRVDVLLDSRRADNDSISDVVLQNLKVLAVDQMADSVANKPAVARAVTLEVEIAQAQRLILAQDPSARSRWSCATSDRTRSRRAAASPARNWPPPPGRKAEDPTRSSPSSAGQDGKTTRSPCRKNETCIMRGASRSDETRSGGSQYPASSRPWRPTQTKGRPQQDCSCGRRADPSPRSTSRWAPRVRSRPGARSSISWSAIPT